MSGDVRALHTFEVDTWVWLPDVHQHAIPARVVERSFVSGSPAVVETEDGMQFELEGKDTKALEPLDPEVLGTDIADLIKLGDLTEKSLMHVLRTRYMSNIIYTSVGSILVSINPFKPLPLYTPDIVAAYMEPGMSDKFLPHIFGITGGAFRQLLSAKKSQAMLISGESGAGKTEATKHILRFLAAASSDMQQRAAGMDAPGAAAGSAGAGASTLGQLERQIIAANPLMEAFGNAKTIHNNNSSRFGKLISIQLSKVGQIMGANIIQYLLEKSRVVAQAKDERNYHIFYQLLGGVAEDPSLQKALALGEAEDYIFLSQEEGEQALRIEGVDDEAEFAETWGSMELLRMSPEEQMGSFKMIAAVLHLGNVEFEAAPNDTGVEACRVKYGDPLRKAAALLGVDFAKLQDSLLQHELGTKRESSYMIPYSAPQAGDARDALAKALYARLFAWLIRKVNRTIMEGYADGLNMNVLDIFGFEVFAVNSFEQLCINYANEKLHYFFSSHLLREEVAEYEREGVTVRSITWHDNAGCVELLERAHTGIFAMVDEEIRLPRGSDEALLEKIFRSHAEHASLARATLGRGGISEAHECFVIKHFAGSVTYNIAGFMDKNKDAIADAHEKLLSDSGSTFVAAVMDAAAGASAMGAGRVRSQSALARRPTLAAQFKRQLLQLTDTLNAADPHYVRCVKPNQAKVAGNFDALHVLEQLRCAGLLGVCQLRRWGFAVRQPIATFVRNYGPLSSGDAPAGTGADDALSLVTHLRRAALLSATDSAVGSTKVFLTAKAHTVLEEKRYEGVVQFAIRVQTQIRAALGRRMHARRQVVLNSLRDATKRADAAELLGVLRQCPTLPYNGLHLPEFKAARRLQVRLREEARVNALLDEAARTVNLEQLKEGVDLAQAMKPPLESASLEKARYILDNQGSYLQKLNDAVAARDYKVVLKLVDDAAKLGMSSEAAVHAAREHLPELKVEDDAKSSLRDALPTATQATLTEHQARLEKLGLRDSDEYKQAERKKQQLEEARDALAQLGSAVQAAAKSRYLPPLVLALRKCRELGVDPSEERMVAAATLQEELQLEASVREAEEAYVPAVAADETGADEDEEKSGSGGSRRQSTTVEECEEQLKAAIRAHDTAALAHGIADAERLQVAESSVVLKTARRTHNKWVSEAADRRKVRAIELKAKAALDAHDQSALQLTLQEASEAGILAEQCEWLQSAKTTYESWLSEANAWRSQVSRRMGVIKLVKMVLAETDVQVTKLEEAEAQLKTAGTWLKEARVWTPQVVARMGMVRRVRSAALGSGVVSGAVESALQTLEEEMPWLHATGERVHWGKKLRERIDSVQRIQIAVGEGTGEDGGIEGELVEDAHAALADVLQWFSDPVTERWRKILNQRVEALRLLNAATASAHVPAATVEGASALVETVAWLAEQDTLRTEITQRLEQMSLFEQVGTQDNVPASLLERAEIEAKTFTWLEDEEAKRWVEEATSRIDIFNVVKQALRDKGVTPAELGAASKAVERTLPWLVEGKMWRQRIKKRLACVSTTVMAASQPQGVQGEAVEEAYRHILGDPKDGVAADDSSGALGWLSVDRLSEEALKERYRVLKHLQEASSSSSVSATRVEKAVAALDSATVWLADCARIRDSLMTRATQVRVMRTALANRDVELEQLDKAVAIISEIEYLEESKDWITTINERADLVGLVKRAWTKVSSLPAPVVERAAQAIVDGKLTWAAEKDIGMFRREVLERKRDLELVKAGVASAAVPAKSVEEALPPLERVLNWLSTTEAVEWRQALERRADTVSVLRAALADTEVTALAVEAAVQRIEQGQSWLDEFEAWQQTIMARNSDLQLLLAAVQESGVSAADVEAAEAPLDRAIKWLVEASGWKDILTERTTLIVALRRLALAEGISYETFNTDKAQCGDSRSGGQWLVEYPAWQSAMKQRAKMMEFFHRAALKTNVPAGVIEMAEAEVIPNCTGWLEDSEEWSALVESRMADIRLCRNALDEQNVRAQVVENANERVVSAQEWLVDAAGWAPLIEKRHAVVKRVREACVSESGVEAQTVTFAFGALGHAAGRDAQTWLTVDADWSDALKTRVDDIFMLQGAAFGDRVTADQLEAAATAADSAVEWLKDATAWKSIIDERSEAVTVLRTALAARDVSLDDVQKAQDAVNSVQTWLAEAMEWRSTLQRRMQLCSALQAATSTKRAVTMSMIDAAWRDMDNGSVDWLGEAEATTFKSEIEQRRLDAFAVREAVGYNDVAAASVEGAVEPLESVLQWMSDPELSSWKAKIGSRAETLQLLRAAIASSLVSVSTLEKAQAALGGAIWLAEASSWDTVISGRVKDMQHVRSVAESNSVPSNMVETVREPLDRVSKYLEEATLSIWRKEVEQRVEHLELVTAALQEQGTTVEDLELAMRETDVTKPWLMEASTLKMQLEQRTEAVKVMRAALVDSNVPVARVEAAADMLKRAEINWLDGDQATHWETRVTERAKAVALMRAAAAPTAVDAASIISAGQLIQSKQHRWLADPERRNWTTIVSGRVEGVNAIQRALGDRVSATMLQAAQVVVDDAQPWLVEAPQWREELQQRIDLMELLKKAAISDYMQAETVNSASQKALDAQWLQEMPTWQARIADRMEVITLIRDQALGDSSVAAEQIVVAMQAIERASSWLAEAFTWKAQLQRRLDQINVIKAALIDMNVPASDVEAAAPVVNEVQSWLAEAPSWKQHLDQRMSDIALVRAAIAQNSSVPASTVEQASQSEHQLAWLANQGGWKAEIMRRMKLINLIRSATSRDHSTSVEVIAAAADVVESVQTWLAEGSRWCGIVTRRMQAVRALQSGIKAQVTKEEAELAGHELQDALSWLTNASGWKTLLTQRMELLEIVKAAVEEMNVPASTIEAAEKVIDAALPWLKEARSWKEMISQRGGIVRQLRRALGRTVQLDMVMEAMNALHGAQWLSEASTWQVELEKRKGLVKGIRDEQLAQQERAGMRRMSTVNTGIDKFEAVVHAQSGVGGGVARHHSFNAAATAQGYDIGGHSMSSSQDFGAVLSPDRSMSNFGGMGGMGSRGNALGGAIDLNDFKDVLSKPSFDGHDSLAMERHASLRDGNPLGGSIATSSQQERAPDEQQQRLAQMQQMMTQMQQMQNSSGGQNAELVNSMMGELQRLSMSMQGAGKTDTAAEEVSEDTKPTNSTDNPSSRRPSSTAAEFLRASRRPSIVSSSISDDSEVGPHKRRSSSSTLYSGDGRRLSTDGKGQSKLQQARMALSSYRQALDDMLRQPEANDESCYLALEQKRLEAEISEDEHVQLLEDSGMTLDEFLCHVSPAHRDAQQAEDALKEVDATIAAKEQDIREAQERAKGAVPTDSYEVTLPRGGPLGLLLGANPEGDGLSAVVDMVSGAAAKTGQINDGDLLMSVNGASTMAMDYMTTLNTLQSAPRPVTLCFASLQSKRERDAQTQRGIDALRAAADELKENRAVAMQRARDAREAATSWEEEMTRKTEAIIQEAMQKELDAQNAKAEELAAQKVAEANEAMKAAKEEADEAKRRMEESLKARADAEQAARQKQEEAEALAVTARKASLEHKVKSQVQKLGEDARTTKMKEEMRSKVEAAQEQAKEAEALRDEAVRESERKVAAAAAAKEQAEDEVQRKMAEVEAAMSEALKAQEGAPLQQKRRSSSLIVSGDGGQAHRKGSVEFQKTRNMSYESSTTAEPYASLRRVMLSEYRGCVSALLLCNEEISEWERSYCEQQRLHRRVTEVEHLRVLKELGWTMAQYYGRDKRPPLPEGAMNRMIKEQNIAQYKDCLAGVLCDSEVTNVEHIYVENRRKQLGINSAEHVAVLAELGWTEAQFDSVEKRDAQEDPAMTKAAQVCEFTACLCGVVCDGRVTPRERAFVDHLRQTHAIDDATFQDVLTNLGWSDKEFAAGEQRGVVVTKTSIETMLHRAMLAQYKASLASILADKEVTPVELKYAEEQRRMRAVTMEEHNDMLQSLGWDPQRFALAITGHNICRSPAPEEMGTGDAGEEGGTTGRRKKNARNTYDVVIEATAAGDTTPLGLLWRNNFKPRKSAVVESVQGLAAATVPQIAPGDVLMAVGENGTWFSTSDLSFAQTMASLRTAIETCTSQGKPKKLQLRLRRSWYEVTLPDGPLGILLTDRADGLDQSAIVEEVSGIAAESGRIQKGHALVSANGVDTMSLDFKDTMQVLRKASRPVTLRFRPAPPAETRTTGKGRYRFTFGEGSLGLLFGANPNGASLPSVIERVTGAARETGKMQLRHELRVVNGHDVSGVGFERTMTLLRGAARPLTLEFDREPSSASPPEHALSDDEAIVARKPTLQTIGRAGSAHPSLASGGAKDRNIFAANASSATDQDQSAAGEAKSAKTGRVPRQKKRSSIEDKASKALPREYSVVIKEQAVGLALVANTGGTDTAPIVDDIQGPALEAGTISKGDCLIGINDTDTRQGNYFQTLQKLKKEPRPVTLRFRSTLPSAETSTGDVHGAAAPARADDGALVDVELDTNGPLGILVAGKTGAGAKGTVVERVGGAAAATGKVAPGQELMAVNGTDVSSMSYDEVIKVLKDASRPINLRLRTPAGNQLNGGKGKGKGKGKKKGSGRSKAASSRQLPTARAPDMWPRIEVTLDTDGPLGLLLASQPGEDQSGAVVEQLGGVAATARSADGGQIIVGHLLLAINGKDMSTSSYYEALSALKQASRPVTLTFGSPESDAGTVQGGTAAKTDAPSVEVTLEGTGPLGILLGHRADGVNEGAMVEQVGAEALASGKIEAGQRLLAVNGQDVSRVPYFKALDVLRSAKRPVTLLLQQASDALLSKPTAAQAKQAPQADEAAQAATKLQATMRGTHVRKKTVPKVEMAAVSDDAAASLPKLPNSPRPGLDMHRTLGDNYYEVMVAPGPLGILLSGNPNGPDLGASVEKVPAGGQCEGKVHPGDLLVKIGDVQAGELSFEEVLRILKAAKRPTCLGFVAPLPLPVPVTTSYEQGAFTVYPMQDPTQSMPARMVLSTGPRGAQLSTPGAAHTEEATVWFMDWRSVASFAGQTQTKNPDDMELLVVTTRKLGTFIFEVNEFKPIVALMEAWKGAIRQRHADSRERSNSARQLQALVSKGSLMANGVVGNVVDQATGVVGQATSVLTGAAAQAARAAGTGLASGLGALGKLRGTAQNTMKSAATGALEVLRSPDDVPRKKSGIVTLADRGRDGQPTESARARARSRSRSRSRKANAGGSPDSPTRRRKKTGQTHLSRPPDRATDR